MLLYSSNTPVGQQAESREHLTPTCQAAHARCGHFTYAMPCATSSCTPLCCRTGCVAAGLPIELWAWARMQLQAQLRSLLLLSFVVGCRYPLLLALHYLT
jgi:hypothetical protein